MTARTKLLLPIAGGLMVLNAALHFFSFAVSGVNPDTIQFMVIGVIYGVIAFGLLKSTGWLSCLTFVIALFGANAALIGIDILAISDLVLRLIAVTDIAVAAVLFLEIWRRP